MTEDLDELLITFLEHYDELGAPDYLIGRSSERYHRLRAEFEAKYDTCEHDVRAAGHWDAPV